MESFPRCRWRGAEKNPGRYECKSAKLVISAAGVDAATCLSCPCANHEPVNNGRPGYIQADGTIPAEPARTEPPPATPTRLKLDCLHRGAELRTEKCPGCQGHVEVKVFSCAVHGECTLQKSLGAMTCVRCPDKKAPEKAPEKAAEPVQAAPSTPVRKAILHNRLSPGDCLVMTAALECLHTQYPGKFLTAVRSPCDDIFAHNPRVATVPAGETWQELKTHYPMVNQSNQRPMHFMEAYCRSIGDQLGVKIDLTVNRPALYFSDQEKSWIGRIEEIYGSPRKYWILNAGVKPDFPAKAWIMDRWQEVVDRLQGKILFVQIGEASHNHPRLKNVVDQVGKTNLREFLRLCRLAEGAVGPSTLLQHAMAALEKPYVCIAGGREPPSWLHYNTQTTLHTIGALTCCQKEACWVSRIVPTDQKDTSVCRQTLPLSGTQVQRCMTLITADDVVRAILKHYDGGALSF